jgi:hypothetical protein
VRFVAIAALFVVVALPAAAAPTPVAHVKNTNGWIESLAMDGPRLAYAVEGGATCTKVFVWNVATQGGALVSGKGTCEADSTSTGGGVTQIAVAGTQLAWLVNQGGNTESDDYLYTASLPHPKERLVASARRTGNVDGTLTGSWLGGLVGGGDRIALNEFTTDASGTVETVALRRLGAGLSTIAAGTDTLRAASLEGRRVAVLRVDQTVALYSTDTGQLLRTLAPSSAREVALFQDLLVVLTRTGTLEALDARKGTPLNTFPVAVGAAHLDFRAGLAVYASGRTVHVLRLADGQDRVLARTPRAVVGVQIEAPGIAYAYNTVKGPEDVGNVAFVPIRKATSVFR